MMKEMPVFSSNPGRFYPEFRRAFGPDDLALLSSAISAAPKWWSLIFIFIFSAGISLAHNPSSSWAQVRRQNDVLELRVEMATEAAWLFLGESRDTAPAIDRSMSRLQAAAGSVYHLSVGNRVLTPTTVSAELREEDGVALRLIFQLPKGNARVRFEASYLKQMLADHRTSLTLFDQGNNVIHTETMTAANSAVEMALPTNASSTASAPRRPFRIGIAAISVCLIALLGYCLRR